MRNWLILVWLAVALADNFTAVSPHPGHPLPSDPGDPSPSLGGANFKSSIPGKLEDVANSLVC